MNKLVIFGGGDLADLAHYYFSHDSAYEVAAFTLDEQYIDRETRNELPVVPFEQLVSIYPPAKYDVFVALGYSKLNALRVERYLQVVESGYRVPSYVSSRAYVANNVVIGDNCFLLEDNTIQPFVKIGNNCTLWSGNHVGHHSTIDDHNFITSHVVISGGVVIGERCFLGVNATLRDHITIGEKSVIGAGATILSDVEPEGVYITKATERAKVPSSRLRRI